MATAPASRFRAAGSLERLADRLQRLPLGSGRSWLRRLYRTALMIRSGGRGLRSELPDGQVIYVSPEHRYLSWNRTEYDAFRDAVQPGAVALDIGANVGAYTLPLAKWVQPSGTVYAFEPAPSAYDGLMRHLAMNNLAANVTAVQAAMSDISSQSGFIIGNTAGEGRLAVASDSTAPTVYVPVTTIDDFCARERITPDFIKIDVEGHETAVLRGARDTLRRSRGRAAVFVEVHPRIWPAIGTSRTELEDELRYQQMKLAPLIPMVDWISVDGLCLQVIPVSCES
jgi:FkbM family methyltransferase